MTASTVPTSGPRIVTLTMNPALEITTTIDTITPNGRLRCGPPRYEPGGGGITVARVAHALGAAVTVVFPEGGTTGEYLVKTLATEAGIQARRVEIAGPTRESFTVNERSTGRQYRFVLPGPQLSTPEQIDCLTQLHWAAASARYVVASGSLPPGVAPSFYQRVADMCGRDGTRLILDTSGTGVHHITSGVFLLKPNVSELSACVGHQLPSQSDQLAAARELINRGCAEHILLSLGPQGALLVTAETSQHYPAVAVENRGGVGAGDAMVAAIAVGLNHGWPLDRAVQLGIAAGAAMRLTPGTAPCRVSDVAHLSTRVSDPVPAAEQLALYDFISHHTATA